MTEVKFACPQCSQHIACDAHFAGIRIECPACGQVMLVPLLGIAGETGTQHLITAKSPPRQSSGSQSHRSGYWNEKEWSDHYRNTTGETLREIPAIVYILAAIFLLPVVAMGVLFLGCAAACSQ